MLVHEDYLGSAAFASFCFVLVLLLVAYAIYLLTKKKQNNTFNLILSAGLIYLFFNIGMWMGDQSSRSYFAYSTKGYTFYGLTSVQSIRQKTGIESHWCEHNHSVTSKQCRFLQLADTTEQYASMVILKGESESDVYVRAGTWPFTHYQKFTYN